MHNNSQIRTGPETTGITLHSARTYSFFAKLMGLGVMGSNSRMVVEMTNIKPGAKVLDVGSGTGDLTLTARKYAGASGSAYGIDASPEMVDVARKKAKRIGSDTVFEVGLVEKLPYPDATFDIVISRLVIHHLPGDLKCQAFGEIYRVLKPGGRIFLTDFKQPTNHILTHLTSAFVGHKMMQSNIWGIPTVLAKMGFIDISSGPTHSRFLAFVSAKKPSLT